MENITVNIVGGNEQENTSAVTIANIRWGLNGNANFGQAQMVPDGIQDLVVFKTTQPQQISIKLDVHNTLDHVNITVNNDSIIVT
jgi:hypothetical protein